MICVYLQDLCNKEETKLFIIAKISQFSSKISKCSATRQLAV